MLREPFARFLSEWQHVQRGATWYNSLHMCNGKPPKIQQWPSCFNVTWANVSLDEFLACPSNFAFNRQTRMLADLAEVGCYSSKLSDAKSRAKMLESAKRNLKRFAFFGITERQGDSQIIFEDTFKLTFKK